MPGYVPIPTSSFFGTRPREVSAEPKHNWLKWCSVTEQRQVFLPAPGSYILQVTWGEKSVTGSSCPSQHGRDGFQTQFIRWVVIHKTHDICTVLFKGEKSLGM